jgi:hypothetical protein
VRVTYTVTEGIGYYNELDWSVTDPDGNGYDTTDGIFSGWNTLGSSSGAHGKHAGIVVFQIPKSMTHGLIIFDAGSDTASWKFQKANSARLPGVARRVGRRRHPTRCWGPSRVGLLRRDAVSRSDIQLLARSRRAPRVPQGSGIGGQRRATAVNITTTTAEHRSRFTWANSRSIGWARLVSNQRPPLARLSRHATDHPPESATSDDASVVVAAPPSSSGAVDVRNGCQPASRAPGDGYHEPRSCGRLTHSNIEPTVRVP